ncbi:MAG: hypothetical protein JNM94_10390 [Phycisphaerae bacterium]|nr:hypothetical protein [Phycisphaerae bacterium]
MRLTLTLACAFATAAPSLAAGDPPSVIPARVAIDTSAFRPSADEAAEIQRLLDRLVEIDAPDRGMAPYMSGRQFAPIPESATFDSGILGAHHLVTPNEVKRLVELGPKALPYLLAAVDDKTPTKFTMTHGGGFGAMWHAAEVDVPKHSAREVAAAANHPDVNGGDPFGNDNTHISSWTITRGDVAFVILGQILNRSYQAVRYQPTACNVVNSPIHTPAIAAYLREAWRGEDSADVLLQSLLNDLRAHETDWSADRVAGAVQRLLYYFPTVAEPIVVALLDGMQGGDRAPLDADILVAIRFTDRPAILDAMLRAAERTGSHTLVPAIATPAVRDFARDRLLRLATNVLENPAPIQLGPFDDSYHTLIAVLQLFPAESERLTKAHLATAPKARAWPIIVALKSAPVPTPWAIPFLRPYLDDETATGWEYGPNYDRRPYQIRHFAGESIARQISGLTFTPHGENIDPDDVPAMLDRVRRAADGDLTALVADEPDHVAAAPKAIAALASVTIPDSLLVLDVQNEGRRVLALRWHEGGERDAVTIDLASGAVTSLTTIPELGACTGVDLVRGGSPTRLAAYERSTGLVTVASLDPVAPPSTVKTGLPPCERVGRNPDCPGMFDGTALTDDGRTMLVLTNNMRLLAVSMEDGSVTEVWKHDGEIEADAIAFANAQVKPLGNDEFLLTGIPKDGEPLSLRSHGSVARVWSHARRSMRSVERVPAFGLNAGWGHVAWNNVNGDTTLWDLRNGERIKLPFPGSEVRQIVVDPRRMRAYALRGDGSIAAVDLASRTIVATLTPPATADDRSSDELRLAHDGESLLYVLRPQPTGADAASETTMTAFDVRGLP